MIVIISKATNAVYNTGIALKPLKENAIKPIGNIEINVMISAMPIDFLTLLDRVFFFKMRMPKRVK